MDVRMAAACAARVGNVAAFCREQRISRQSFYVWRARFAAGGVAGLVDRSRRPLRCPVATPVAVEDAVVVARAELIGDGADHGPDAIRWRLLDAGVVARVPSRATISRILLRRGVVVPQPGKAPRCKGHRFVYERPNDLWQSDWTGYALRAGTAVGIAGCLDDHSRYVPALDAQLGSATAGFVWQVMLAGIGECGIPARSLTDNGLVYSTRRRGLVESAFEANLRALGCRAICSSPYHPQTCGKIERFWQTLKKWLDAHGPYDTLEQLRAALGVFRVYYNTQRRHRALHSQTPAQVFRASPLARPAEHPLPAPSVLTRVRVSAAGAVPVNRYQVYVGRALIGLPVDVVTNGDFVVIFAGTLLVRQLTLDPTRIYQPAGCGRGHRYEPHPIDPANRPGVGRVHAGRAAALPANSLPRPGRDPRVKDLAKPSPTGASASLTRGVARP